MGEGALELGFSFPGLQLDTFYSGTTVSFWQISMEKDAQMSSKCRERCILSDQNTIVHPRNGKQAALSWVISISVITHQHVHKQTRNKSWLHVHTSNVVVNTGSQKTNQPHSKENSNGWIQCMVFQHKPFLPSAKCVAIALHYEYLNSHALQRHLSSMQIKLNLQYTF